MDQLPVLQQGNKARERVHCVKSHELPEILAFYSGADARTGCGLFGDKDIDLVSREGHVVLNVGAQRSENACYFALESDRFFVNFHLLTTRSWGLFGPLVLGEEHHAGCDNKIIVACEASIEVTSSISSVWVLLALWLAWIVWRAQLSSLRRGAVQRRLSFPALIHSPQGAVATQKQIAIRDLLAKKAG